MATATTNPQGDASSKGEAQSSNDNSRFMFVEFSAPAGPVPKGTKKRRGGPSEVRAHITKEYHRKLRVKRLGRPKTNEDVESTVVESDTHERLALPDRSKAGEIERTTSLVDLDDNQYQRKHSHDESMLRRASSSSWSTVSAVAGALSPQSEIVTNMSSSPILHNLLGEGRLDPFDALPSQGMPMFIHRVLDHGRSPPTSSIKTIPIVRPSLPFPTSLQIG